MNRKYEYQLMEPRPRFGASSPVMTPYDMECWLNDMDKQGLEFVGYAQKNWSSPKHTQEFWIFRRPYKS